MQPKEKKSRKSYALGKMNKMAWANHSGLSLRQFVEFQTIRYYEGQRESQLLLFCQYFMVQYLCLALACHLCWFNTLASILKINQTFNLYSRFAISDYHSIIHRIRIEIFKLRAKPKMFRICQNDHVLREIDLPHAFRVKNQG